MKNGPVAGERIAPSSYLGGRHPRMVAQFGELSGDHSSLHTDAAFAGKSPYRGHVAHGMLPLIFLAVLAMSPYR